MPSAQLATHNVNCQLDIAFDELTFIHNKPARVWKPPSVDDGSLFFLDGVIDGCEPMSSSSKQYVRTEYDITHR